MFFLLKSFCSSTLQHASRPSYLISLYHLYGTQNSKVHNACGKGHGIFAYMAKQNKELSSKFTVRNEIRKTGCSCPSSESSYKNHIASEIVSISLVVYTEYEETFIITEPRYNYRGADKSLVPPGRKQARTHDRDMRDFNHIETRAVIK